MGVDLKIMRISHASWHIKDGHEGYSPRAVSEIDLERPKPAYDRIMQAVSEDGFELDVPIECYQHYDSKLNTYTYGPIETDAYDKPLMGIRAGDLSQHTNEILETCDGDMLRKRNYEDVHTEDNGWIKSAEHYRPLKAALDYVAALSPHDVIVLYWH